MVIGVAGFTILFEPQKSIAPSFQPLVFYKIRFMALPAVYCFVRSCQVVSRQAVVEILLIETHDIEIPAVMVAVAGGAAFPFYFFRCMETHAIIHPAFYFFMATQAFVVRYFVSQIMAFRTIEHAFQVSVRLRQIAGRQLCIHL